MTTSLPSQFPQDTTAAITASITPSQPQLQIELVADTAFGSLQTDFKRELTPDQLILEKRLTNITALLKSYSPDVTLETVKAIPINQIGIIAMTILFLKPLKDKNQQIKEESIGAFLSDRCFLTRNHTEYVTCYQKFWQACKISNKVKESLQEQLKDALELFQIPENADDYIPLATQMHKKEAQELIFQIIQDYCAHLEKYWKKTHEFLSGVSKDFQEHLDSLPKIKKEMEKKGISKKQIDSQSGDSAFNICIPLINRLNFQLHSSLPRLRQSFSRLDLNDIAFSQFISIHTLAKHFRSEVVKITGLINKELANYEFQCAYNTGNPPLSYHGLRRSRDFYKKNLEIKKNFILRLQTAIQKIKDFYPEGFKQQKMTKNQFDLLFECLINIVKKEPTPKIDRDLPPLFEIFLREIEIEFKDILTIAHQEIFQLNLERSKSEDTAKNYIGIFDGDILRFFVILQEQQNKKSNFFVYMNFDAILIDIIKEFSDLAVGVQLKANSNDDFIEWRQAMKHPKITAETLSINTSEMEHAAHIISKNQSLQTSFSLFGHLFKSFDSIQEDIIEKENAEKADDCLHLLELEEEASEAIIKAEIESRAKIEEAKKDKKLEKNWVARTDLQANTAATEIPKAAEKAEDVFPTILLPASPFNTPTSQMLFDLRNEIARRNGINPAEIIAPADVAKKKLSADKLAVHQQIYAIDNFALSLEMHSACNHAEDKAVLFQLVLKWGYRALEQGLTTEYIKKYPKRFLRHHLNILQRGLGMAIQNNWTKHAVSHSLYHRYPWYFKMRASKCLPMALQTIKDSHSEAAKTFEAMTSTLVTENISMQIAILTHHSQDQQDPHLKRVQDTFKAFQSAQQKEKFGKPIQEAHSKENAQLLEEMGNKFPTLIQKFETAQKGLSGEVQKALLNSRKHFSNIQAGVRLLKRFPQQRFVHILSEFIFSSGKDFSENLGAFLSIKREKPEYTHSLQTYIKDHGLGKNLKGVLQTVRNSSVDKGDEYPFKYFAFMPERSISSHMTLLSDLYKLSSEAKLLGEGATLKGQGVKEASEAILKGIQFSKSIAEAACALASKHV